VANSCWNIYNFRMNLIRKLISNNNKVITVAPVDEYIHFIEMVPGIEHVPLSSLSRKSTNPLKELALVLALYRIYKKLNPDIIIHYTHKPNIYGGVAAALLGVRSIAVLTGLGYAFIRKGWLNRLTSLLYRLTGRLHKAMIFENQDDRQLFVDRGMVKPNRAFAIKGCGVDLDRYRPASERREKGQTLVFTFIGRLLYDKGIVEFIEAGKRLMVDNPEVRLHIAGEFDSGNPSMVPRALLLEWIRHPAIRYFGFVEDVRPVMHDSDCIVLPSYREGMPRVVLEAMAMAIPVITTDVPGCRETVNAGESGFLVKAKDAFSLHEALSAFAGLTPNERRAMGQKGYDRAVNIFNSEKIAQELYEIISQVYFCFK